jgi:hypothetical protein
LTWERLTASIGLSVDTAVDEFITGKRSVSQGDAYVQAVKTMGVDSAVESVQTWYDNYWKSLGN